MRAGQTEPGASTGPPVVTEDISGGVTFQHLPPPYGVCQSRFAPGTLPSPNLR